MSVLKVKNKNYKGARTYRNVRQKLLNGDTENINEYYLRPYTRQRILATPPWVQPRELRCVYQRAQELSKVYGEPFNVDHVIPLSHPYVCGLHVPWNLVPLPERANLAKGNTWHEGQNEMFNEPEQLRLFL